MPEIITNQLKTSDGKRVKNVGLFQAKYFNIVPHDDGSIDWVKSKEIPLVQIKSAITNKALPSNFKVKQVTGIDNKPAPATKTTYKHSATGGDGVKIFSNDGKTWFTKEGKKVE